ncbi:hypothetical protein GGTG_04155 [Gaeumannomyces tritici R3-111a-1]|uniref:Uncharacterized protein n=1 Tax=Gaeumannomyces tritici (strain R3-111a-1) TaxID=644352 RepID=J3NSB0_GAET3|nr:hypothetical protein GGTG_04155 [Gaeumannomyces tritici R3-111a-1]EJT79066.1 hypothetical protein GGTG_04155 [Gaeumannomyces tritici R3-111a-1]
MRNATMMALIVFSCPIPLEYFWPKEAAEPLPPYRRPNTAEAKEHGRLRGRPERSCYHVRCFGIKGFNLVPGTQRPHREQPLLPSVVVEPMDDHYLSDRRDQMKMSARQEEIGEAGRKRAIADQERWEAESAARQAEARRRQELDWV